MIEITSSWIEQCTNDGLLAESPNFASGHTELQLTEYGWDFIMSMDNAGHDFRVRDRDVLRGLFPSDAEILASQLEILQAVLAFAPVGGVDSTTSDPGEADVHEAAPADS